MQDDQQNTNPQLSGEQEVVDVEFTPSADALEDEGMSQDGTSGEESDQAELRKKMQNPNGEGENLDTSEDMDEDDDVDDDDSNY